jgi:hypothetical protein
MTIDELIELAGDAREDLGGAQLRIACQPGYRLRAVLAYVTVPPGTSPSEPADSLNEQIHPAASRSCVCGHPVYFPGRRPCCSR